MIRVVIAVPYNFDELETIVAEVTQTVTYQMPPGSAASKTNLNECYLVLPATADYAGIWKHNKMTAQHFYCASSAVTMST